MINPDFWLDEEIGSSSQACRLLYIGTWNHSDDYGVIECSPQKLKAQVFPYDDVDVRPLMDNLIALKKLLPFDVDGKKYLYIKNFLKYQKVDKPSQYRYPPAPRELLAEYPEITRIVLTSEEKRREEKRSKKKRSEVNYLDQKFVSFWNEYPKKVGKSNAYELWEELSETQKDLILADVPERKSDEKWVGGFIKDPERYIKNRQWEDEIKITSNLDLN